MLRKLLACLALLTGLAAAGAPAQAEVAVAMASQVEARAACDAGAAGQIALRAARPVAAHVPDQGSLERASQGRLTFFSAVYLRIDRARE